MSAPMERSTKKRTAMEADSISLKEDVQAKKRKIGREEKEEDVEAEKRTNGKEEKEEEDVEVDKRNNGREEEEDIESNKRNNGRDEEQEEEASQEEDVKAEKRNLGKVVEKDSSIVLLPGANLFFSDPKAFFAQLYQDEKSAPKVEIPTLDRFEPPTIFHTPRLLRIREPGSKAVLSAAEVLLGISSSLRGKPLKRCSGFWIDWDEESKTGTVVTTANLIRTKDPPGNDVWIEGAHYDSEASTSHRSFARWHQCRGPATLLPDPLRSCLLEC